MFIKLIMIDFLIVKYSRHHYNGIFLNCACAIENILNFVKNKGVKLKRISTDIFFIHAILRIIKFFLKHKFQSIFYQTVISF